MSQPTRRSVFSRVLDVVRRGKTPGVEGGTAPQVPQRTVLTGQPQRPGWNPIEAKQQEFLDVQSQKIAYDLYSRSIYYDTDRLTSYNDFKAMDMSPEVSAALDIITDECIEYGTMIPLLDGRKVPIGELYDSGVKNFYVYSYNVTTREVEPALCEKVAYKGEQNVYDVVFDDGSSILATSNHKWLIKGEDKYLTTSKLKIGTSIEPFYTRKSDVGDRISGYEMVLEGGKWKYTHRIVKRKLWNEDKGVVHHEDFDKLNNDPSNLKVMDFFDHQKLHSSLNSLRWKNDKAYSNKMSKVFSKTNKKDGPYWSNPEWRAKRIKQMSEIHSNRFANMSKEDRDKYGSKGEKNGMYGNGHKLSGDKNGRYRDDLRHHFTMDELIEARILCDSMDDVENHLNTERRIIYKSKAYRDLEIQRWEDIDFIIDDISIESLKEACLNSKCSNIKRSYSNICDNNGWKPRKVRTFLNKNDFANFSEFVDTINHKIIDIKLVGKRKTYDLVNVGEHHNFAVLTSNGTGVFTHNCLTRNERGDILSIYSNNARIKNVLSDLFLKVLNVDYSLMFWIRELVKYGDFFLKLEIHKDLGVYDARALPPAEIHREEAYDGNISSARFKWDLNNMYFEEWQVGHFRLATDGARLPYGRSILEPARKLWKQLQLAEDAMLVYRIIRAPERRVYYIEVGNIDNKDVPQYMEKIKRDIKKTSVVDQNTGQVNVKFNAITMEEDYFIPIRGDKGSRVETIAGASNISEIQDIEYLQNKLFAALKVPKAYLNYAESMEGGSTLSQADLRFSRTIVRIQEMILTELRRIANIHLFFLGFEDDVDNFSLTLTNPSTQQELLKLETMKHRLEVFKEMFSNDVTSPVSYTWGMQYVLGFSESEIKLILRQKKVEKKMFAEIEESPETYKKTGLFVDLDRRFEKLMAAGESPEGGAEGEDDMDMGGGGGGMSMDSGLGGPEVPTFDPEDGGGDVGGDMEGGGGEEEELAEGSSKLLKENNKMMADTRNLLKNIKKQLGVEDNKKENL